MRPVGWVLIQCNWYLYNKRKTPCEDRDTQEECHVTTETEIGVCSCKPRNAQDCWQPPEAGKTQEGIYQCQRKHSLANTLTFHFRPPERWEKTSVVFSHPVCSTLSQEPSATKTASVPSPLYYMIHNTSEKAHGLADLHYLLHLQYCAS